MASLLRPLGKGRFSGASVIYSNEDGGLDSILKKLVLRHETFVAPLAPNTAVHAQFAGDFDHVEAGLTQPDVPKNIEFVTNAAWDGGDLEVTGITNEGCERVETIAAVAGGGTAVGLYAFVKVTHLKNTGTYGAGAADVRHGSKLGVLATNIASFVKLVANKVVEAFSSSSVVYGTFTPTTAPDAAKHFEVYYTVETTGNRAANEP
jgi:hypothetical protein